jgi:hypothetical protein
MRTPTSRWVVGQSFNRTTVLSKIHQYNYACARRQIAPDGTRNTTGCRPRPWAQVPPRLTQNSTSGVGSASPEPGLGYLRPRESHGRPLHRLWHIPSNLKTRLGRNLGRTSASPEHGSSSISVTEDIPNVIRNSRTDASHKKLFPMTGTVSTTTVWATPRQGLGYVTEPSASPLALSRKQASTSQR